MAVSVQSSFNFGEWAPALYGHDEMEQYAKAAKSIQNMIVSKHGAAVSRPGTKFVGYAYQHIAGWGPSKMFKFQYSETDTYILVFTGGAAAEFGTMRVIKNGVYVPDPITPANPYTISTPWKNVDVTKLKVAQLGNLMVVNHRDSKPCTLVRVADDDWVIGTLSFDLPPFNWGDGDPMHLMTPVIEYPIDGAATPKKDWKYVATVVVYHKSGYWRESAPFSITGYIEFQGGKNPPDRVPHDLPATFGVTPDKPLAINFSIFNGFLGVTDYLFWSMKIYKGRNDVYGLCPEGEVSLLSGGMRFIDFGADPQFERPPPRGTNPFKIFKFDQSVTIENPVCPAFFEQRLYMVGTAERPDRVFASAINDFFNHDVRLIPVAEMAFQFPLASNQYEECHSVIPIEKLLIFTESSVWVVGGRDGEPVTALGTPQARIQSYAGASWVTPVTVGNTVLYVRSKGFGLQDLYSDVNDQYVGHDISFMAAHLFENDTVRSMTYAEDPWGVVWVAMQSGKLNSLTYVREYNVLAWAHHEIDGDVEDVCSVPEGQEDAVYLIVKRRIAGKDRRFILRMTSRQITNVADAICLDYSVSHTVSFPEAGVVTGLGHLEGETVNALVDGVVFRNLQVQGGQVNLPVGINDQAHVGLGYVAHLKTLPVAAIRGKQIAVTRVFADVEYSTGAEAGIDESHLEKLPSRSSEDGYGVVPLFTGRQEINAMDHGFDYKGEIMIQQSDPLPLTVSALAREIVAGD